MPAVDLVARVRRLAAIPGSALANLLDPDGERHWGPHEENTARLYEALRYWLQIEWRDRTVDPNDPEERAARREASKVRPPVDPPIPPVALRPPGLAERHVEAWIESTRKAARAGRERVTVTSDDFDKAMGLS
jgi:hypothetical protein